ncbi:hypothetical protein GO196_07355, partial [Campylobacter coli]|nr:hypothetical protein [Campylobacter coli]
IKTMQENTQRHIQNIKISALSGVGIIFMLIYFLSSFFIIVVFKMKKIK